MKRSSRSSASLIARQGSLARTPPKHAGSVNVRASAGSVDGGMGDAVFGIAFFILLSGSGILFIKSAFYESQDLDTILEGDPFSAVGQRLPFAAPRMSESEALAKADDLSAQLRVAISEKEYPIALQLKRELANLMVDYKLDYMVDAEMPIGTRMMDGDADQSEPPSAI
eukprot:CAMPEP_0119420906 /NCGR_PEP_ID=MMETSP1335-20130426/24613_1 /TAXON_ID=259385 /ORGANISM="Chrysoculter rhomboideus, Strain RCC1486" /LENGTH=168 /DNA_ID=CAMNT_0007446285 /DNA_START=1 /DNA_END=507 /DNA_ORIENTATION=+